MTYNVFGVTLSLTTQSINLSQSSC